MKIKITSKGMANLLRLQKHFVFILLLFLCCSCNHSNTQKNAVDNNCIKDTVITQAQQILTPNFRKDVITALYMMGCNDRLKMGLPDDYTENYYGFLDKIDSLVEAPNYFERIEANIANDSYSQDLQDSLHRWLFLERMLLFPQDCNLDLFEYGVTDELAQTHHLLDKYIDRNIQSFESLSISQLDFYIYDMINYLFSLPDAEQMVFIIEYYTKVRDKQKIE